MESEGVYIMEWEWYVLTYYFRRETSVLEWGHHFSSLLPSHDTLSLQHEQRGGAYRANANRGGGGLICGGSGRICRGDGLICGGSGVINEGSGVIHGGSGLINEGRGLIIWRQQVYAWM